jgi:xylan 1,4-beta-xylosidase
MSPPRQLGFAAALLAATFTTSWSQSSPVTFDWFAYSAADTDAAPAGSPGLAPTEYANPRFAGFYPDPSICCVGDDYYLITSTFAYFPGIPIFHSRDLVNWRQLGHVIDRPDQLRYDGLGVSRGIFAPAISHHQRMFYVVCTMVDAGGNFVVTSSDPAGPWSDPVWLGFEGIDPSLFFDDDGRAWTINNGAPESAPLYNGHRAIWIQEFDPVAKKMIGPRAVLVNGGVDLTQKPVWIEGPHIYRRGDWYYLCCAEGGTSIHHSQVIFRSREVTGPYVPWERNPILTQRTLSGDVPGAVTSTGHADLVIGPDENWWAVFLAVRPYQGRYSPMGRETFLLPVSWPEDAWPVILEPGVRVPLVGTSPRGVTRAADATECFDGSRSWRDDFTEPKLAPTWIMLRAANEAWWQLDPSAGLLRLVPRGEFLSGRGNPSFLARRIQHARFTASTSVAAPSEPKVSAGLAVFQGEKHHYFLAVRREGDGVTAYLERHNGGDAETIAQQALGPVTTVRLRVGAEDATCSFAVAAEDGDWRTLLEGADARLLTTQVAGGFVGATVGMHARID